MVPWLTTATSVVPTTDVPAWRRTPPDRLTKVDVQGVVVEPRKGVLLASSSIRPWFTSPVWVPGEHHQPSDPLAPFGPAGNRIVPWLASTVLRVIWPVTSTVASAAMASAGAWTVPEP